MSWLVAVITALVVSAAGYGLHALDLQRLQSQQQAALSSQAGALTTLCTQQKQVTTEVDNALHTQNRLTATHYSAAMQLLNAASCTAPATKPASGNYGTPNNTRLYYTNSQAARALLDRARAAQLQTNQLLACQQFIKDERNESKVFNSPPSE